MVYLNIPISVIEDKVSTVFNSLTTATGEAGTEVILDVENNLLTIPTGEDGVSVESIERTTGDGSAGTTDIYTITLTDATTTTFSIYNGVDGVDGADGLGSGDMLKATYDTTDNGVVDNAELVNGLSVETAVPAGALFTDTVYDDTSIQAEVDLNTAKITYNDAALVAQHTIDINLKAPKASPVFTGSITEQVSTSTLALEPDNGTVQTYTATADATFTDGLAEGQFMTLILTGGSGYTITYPTVLWWGDDAPTLGSVDKLFFEKIGGVLYGSHVGTRA